MAEDDIGRLKKRFSEMAERAYDSSVWQCTKFLNMAEQSLLSTLRLPVRAKLYGGFDGAERRIAYFGSEERMGYPFEPPIECVLIRPADARFSEELTHRDFLGALMGMGITRETLGDIVVTDAGAYLFCLSSIAPVVIDELREVRRTSVVCESAAPPEKLLAEAEERSVVVASERLDALIAAVWKLPREEAKLLCERGLVYVDAKQATRAGSFLNENAVVSVRGRGRFTFLGVERETKKGRLRVNVKLYSR